jgi:nucleoside phosphorylase
MKKKRSKGRPERHGAHEDAPIMNILLVLALPEERSYFHNALEMREGWEPTSERRRYFCMYSSPHGRVKVIVQTLDGMGQIESVLGATSAIVASTPRLVLMVGISGSLHQKIGLGDVVVSNQVKLYSSDKVMSLATLAGHKSQYSLQDLAAPSAPRDAIIVDRRDKFMENSFLRYERKLVSSPHTDDILSHVEGAIKKRRLRQLPASLPSEIKSLPSTKRDRSVHMGWVLGVQHVVDSEEYRGYLVDKNKDIKLDVHRQKGEPERVPWTDGEILAVDMESYGLLRSVEMLREAPSEHGGVQSLIGGIVVRGISDLCTGKGALDDETGRSIRQLAIENATDVCLTLIENLNYRELLGFRR